MRTQKTDLEMRLAGADDERCGSVMHEDAHDEAARALTCDAKPHDAEQAHIAADNGVVILQWHDVELVGEDDQPESG